MTHSIEIQRHEILNGKMHIYYREPGDTGDHCHIFPLDTFEWRVAEFGFDPADKETLLNVVLSERWEEDPPTSELMEVPAASGASDPTALDDVRQSKLARSQGVGLTIVPGPKKQALLSDLPTPAQEAIALRMNVLFDIRNKGNQMMVSRRRVQL